MSRDEIDHEHIKTEVAKDFSSRRVWKVMACGHRDLVFRSVDEKTEMCWTCAPPKDPEVTGESDSSS